MRSTFKGTCALACSALQRLQRLGYNRPATFGCSNLAKYSTSAMLRDKNTTDSNKAATSEMWKLRGGGVGGSNQTEPTMMKGMEDKAIEELADMHVDTVDEDDGFTPWQNQETGEIGGPKGSLRGAEPTRFGDWELNGRVSDF
mmetsp:Transcript_16067/g.36730  ORF Transcript_16067/g.36730 Transcript_16067/m.36730 type:complete len:143 (-) Transcript_16067:147-575(-)